MYMQTFIVCMYICPMCDRRPGATVQLSAQACRPLDVGGGYLRLFSLGVSLLGFFIHFSVRLRRCSWIIDWLCVGLVECVLAGQCVWVGVCGSGSWCACACACAYICMCVCVCVCVCVCECVWIVD